jgi:hypothetical protein
MTASGAAALRNGYPENHPSLDKRERLQPSTSRNMNSGLTALLSLANLRIKLLLSTIAPSQFIQFPKKSIFIASAGAIAVVV